MAKALGLTDEHLYTELYAAWIKDTRERNSQDSKKAFRDVIDRGIHEKEIAFRKERLGVNSAVTLGTILARSPLTKLDLYHNVLRDAGCEAIAQLVRESPNLLTLNLGGNDIGTQGIQALSLVIGTHKRLASLSLGTEAADSYTNRIDSNTTKILCEGLFKNRTLKYLDLCRNPIGKGSQDAFPLLQQLVSQSNALSTLKLSQVNMSTESALLVLSAVAKSSTMACLDLSANNLSSAVGEAIGKMLQERGSRSTPSPLKILSLSDNPLMGERGAKALFAAFQTDKGLTQLDVENCGVTDDALLVLCQSLAVNATMSTLALRRNAVTDVGVTELARSLLRHASLTQLFLAYNKIKDEGACALASTLESNTLLDSLDLEATWVGDRGAIALGVALANNKSLSTLRLSNNHISDEGGAALVALLEKNRALHICTLKGNNMSHSTVLHAQKVLSRNRQAKQEEVPNKLRKEVIKLHYQMYKLEEAKIELDNQRSKKLELDRTQERLEAQYRQEEAEFRKKQKDLLEAQQQQENQCQHYEGQMKTIAENYERMVAQHEVDMAAARERYEAEVAEREKAEEEFKKVHQELEQAETLREQRLEELRSKIKEAKEDREKWIAQSREYREQIAEAQLKLKELESKVVAPVAAAPKDANPKQTKGAKAASDIQSLLATS